jgi:hypothetical protein
MAATSGRNAPTSGASLSGTSRVLSHMERPSFTIGIEEEYLVVDRETRDLIKPSTGDVG